MLAIGGVWLAVLGGSLYYVVTGVAMLAAGVQLVRGRMAGVWIYVAIFVLTFLWALWEVGLEPWALVPRVIAPLVLLIAVLLVMPTLSVARNRWKTGLVSAGAAVLVAACSSASRSPGQCRGCGPAGAELAGHGRSIRPGDGRGLAGLWRKRRARGAIRR